MSEGTWAEVVRTVLGEAPYQALRNVVEKREKSVSSLGSQSDARCLICGSLSLGEESGYVKCSSCGSVDSIAYEEADRERLREITERALRSHPKIRWIAVADETGRFRVSRMRNGVRAVVPLSEDKKMLEILAPIALGLGRKIAELYEGLTYSITRYGKLFFLMMTSEHGIVMATFEKELNLEKPDELAEKIAKSLTIR